MRIGGPRIDVSMLVPLLVMAAGFTLLFLALLLLRMRTVLNERKAMALRLNAGPAPQPRPERGRARRPIRRCAEAVDGRFGAFLAMGGYAGFVWPAYGVAVAVLGGLAAHSWRRYRESARRSSGCSRPGRTRR